MRRTNWFLVHRDTGELYKWGDALDFNSGLNIPADKPMVFRSRRCARFEREAHSVFPSEWRIGKVVVTR